MKKVLVSLVVFLALVSVSTLAKAGGDCLTGCFAPPKPPEPLIIKFNYDPPASTAQKLDITIAVANSEKFGLARQVIGSHMNKEAADNIAKIETALINAIGTDLQKILIAKGFKTTGPFESINVMTYPDKQKANLILYSETKITINDTVINTSSPVRGQYVSSLGSVTGNYEIGGFVSFILQDPITKENMWVKKLELQSQQSDYNFSYDISGKVVGNDNRPQATNRLLSGIYSEAMGKVYTYIDVAEVTDLVKQVEEIRKKKTY